MAARSSGQHGGGLRLGATPAHAGAACSVQRAGLLGTSARASRQRPTTPLSAVQCQPACCRARRTLQLLPPSTLHRIAAGRLNRPRNGNTRSSKPDTQNNQGDSLLERKFCSCAWPTTARAPHTRSTLRLSDSPAYASFFHAHTLSRLRHADARLSELSLSLACQRSFTPSAASQHTCRPASLSLLDCTAAAACLSEQGREGRRPRHRLPLDEGPQKGIPFIPSHGCSTAGPGAAAAPQWRAGLVQA